MSKEIIDALSERERACLEHLRQAQELGVTFSQYCRDRDLPMNRVEGISEGGACGDRSRQNGA